jgi:hypothetical protein
VQPCDMPYNATAELCPPPISPTIVLPEPSRKMMLGKVPSILP